MAQGMKILLMEMVIRNNATKRPCLLQKFLVPLTVVRAKAENLQILDRPVFFFQKFVNVKIWCIRINLFKRSCIANAFIHLTFKYRKDRLFDSA